MKEIYYILIPCGITLFFIGLHVFMSWYSWQKELKRDAERDERVDRLLSDDPGCENEEVLHPAKWEGFMRVVNHK